MGFAKHDLVDAFTEAMVMAWWGQKGGTQDTCSHIWLRPEVGFRAPRLSFGIVVPSSSSSQWAVSENASFLPYS